MKKLAFILFVTFLSTPIQASEGNSSNKLVIAAARSAADSGLVHHLARQFQQSHPGIKIEINAVGALQALDLGREGKADFIITHYPQDEELFIAQEHGLQRTLFMYGEYVLLGPAELLSEFSIYTNIKQALKNIHSDELAFLIPSPRSGTYRKIEELWALAGINPDWVGYENTGVSAAGTLLQSDQLSALSVTDLSLYYTNRDRLSGNTVILYRGDLVLRNPFHAIIVNPDRQPDVNYQAANDFMQFLISDAGQNSISQYTQQTYNANIFTPAAHLDSGLIAEKAKQEIEDQQQRIWIMSALVSILSLSIVAIVYISFRLRKAEKIRMDQAFENQLMRYERDLALESNNVKDEFISVVSHELRTPLTSIIGSLCLLEEILPENNNEEKELVKIANRNSSRLLMVINDLLDMEKISSGTLRLHMEPVSLHAVIEESLQTNDPYAKQFSVAFRYIPLASDIQVIADHDRIIQVMTNLLSNAAKFAPAGSEVIIRCDVESYMIRVSICDQGPGVPDDYKATIFDRFTQVDSSTRREKGGTGLGLAISKSLIEQHNGTIGLKDNQPTGAIFFFELPIHQLSAAEHDN